MIASLPGQWPVRPPRACVKPPVPHGEDEVACRSRVPGQCTASAPRTRGRRQVPGALFDPIGQLHGPHRGPEHRPALFGLYQSDRRRSPCGVRPPAPRALLDRLSGWTARRRSRPSADARSLPGSSTSSFTRRWSRSRPAPCQRRWSVTHRTGGGRPWGACVPMPSAHGRARSPDRSVLHELFQQWCGRDPSQAGYGHAASVRRLLRRPWPVQPRRELGPQFGDTNVHGLTVHNWALQLYKM